MPPSPLARSRWARLALFLCLIGSPACGGDGRYVWVQDLAPIPPSRGQLIQLGDTLTVRVFGQDPMSAKAKVMPDGTVTLPLLGDVPVVNQRPADLARALEARLKPFVNAPSVTVTIEEAPVTVSVIGEVRTPSVVNLEDPPTLSQALARAGGLTEFADSSRIFVVRPNSADVQRIRFDYETLTRGDPRAVRFLLRSGDVVFAE